MSAAGERMFARYAFSPNELGYCGPADASALFELGATGRTAADIGAVARRFSGAWPYLVLLAELTGGTDPLDETLVRAYWLGTPVPGVDHADFGRRLLEWLGTQAGHYWRHLDETLLAEAAPDHGFHVFGVYPWSRLLGSGPADQPVLVLDSCRISPARVVSAGDPIVVGRRPLGWVDGRLRLLAEREQTVRGFVTDAVPGDWLTVHWDWVCDRLTAGEAAELEAATVARLELTNDRLQRAACRRRSASAVMPPDR